MASSPSLLSTSMLYFLFLLSFAPATFGQDIATVSTQLTLQLQAIVNGIDNQKMLSGEIISMLNEFDSLGPPGRDSPDTRWVDQLASQVAGLMQGKVDAVQQLATEIERLYGLDKLDEPVHLYNSRDITTWDARFTSTLQYDPRLQANVSYNYSTVRYADFAQIGDEDDITWSQPIDAIFSENHKNYPTLTHQYFASADGYLRAFPGGDWGIESQPNDPTPNPSKNNIPEFNPGFNARFSNWYVMAASGPKDVVLVLDSSTSMGSLFEVRKAALLVLKGLTPQDYVNVVTFNTNAFVSSCWKDQLVPATDENKQIFTTYLMSLETASGKTNIELGLQAASKLLTESVEKNQSSQCQQLVLLLTDGVTSANHFDIGNAVGARLFAYILNLYTDTSPLQRLACANSGVLVPIPNPSSAYTTMASYYTILAPGREKSSEVWVGPQLNQFTHTGLVLSIVRPCFDRSQSPPVLIGVVGVDMPLEHIDALVRNFVASPSYAFVVNNAGEVIVHPLVPTWSLAKETPPRIDIAEIEGLSGDANFSEVRNHLMRGDTGNVTLNKVVSQLRGYEHFEGFVTWNATAHYYYRRLFADFSVAVVWANIVDRPNLPPISLQRPRGPVTHIRPDPYHVMQQAGRTSFAVSAKGYCDPVWFLNANEDQAFATLIETSVDSNASCPYDLLQPEARYAIQSTSNIDNVWNDSVTDSHPEVKVRFIATHYNGVMRTFPAKTLTSKYDPTNVPWYRRALAYSGGLVASIPHMRSDMRDFLSVFDDSTNSLMFTRIIPYAPANNTTPRNFTSHEQTIYGVVGISMDYRYFSQIFLDTVGSQCRYNSLSGQPGTRCFLIDGSGYFITHPLFLLALPQQNESYIFIGRDEPLLTQSLIRDNVLRAVVANDYFKGTKRVITTYTVADNALSPHPNHTNVLYKSGNLIATSDCVMEGAYFISKLSTSNMYFVVLNVSHGTPCNVYGQTRVTVTEDKPNVCDGTPPLIKYASPCDARRVTYRELEQLRGIQKCQSETNAIILGVIIPLGVGFAILGLVWLVRRHKRMRSMRAGMLVPNAENNERDENADNLRNPEDPNNLDNQDDPNNLPPNPQNLPLPLPGAPPHANNMQVNDIPIDADPPAPSFVVDPQLNNSNPNIPPVLPRSSMRASPRIIPPLRNSAGIQHSPDSELRSSSGSLHGSGNMYFSPFYPDGEDEHHGRSIPMQPIPSSSASQARSGSRVDETSEEEEEDDDGDDEDEDEDEAGSDDSERDSDPNDLFAGMAREMGIPLPRTSRS